MLNDQYDFVWSNVTNAVSPFRKVTERNRFGSEDFRKKKQHKVTVRAVLSRCDSEKSSFGIEKTTIKLEFFKRQKNISLTSSLYR